MDPATGISVTSPHRENWLVRLNGRFNAFYLRLRASYTGVLKSFLTNRNKSFLTTAALVGSAVLIIPFVGRDFFPQVDAGQIRLHVRAAAGTRIEQTKVVFSEVEEELRRVIPPAEISLILDNIGRPAETVDFAFDDGSTIGAFDGQILIALKEGKHSPTDKYISELRRVLPRYFPELVFYFQPADMVTQILDFGLPAPIDIQISGYDPHNYDIARQIRKQISTIPGIVDAHVHQVMDGPDLHLDINRARAAEFGLTAQNVANNMYVSLSSSTLVQPNFFLDPKMGITYSVAAQTPQFRLNTVQKIGNTPVAVKDGGRPQLLSNLASVSHSVEPVNLSHNNVQPIFDIYANVQDSDLGSVASKIDGALKTFRKQLQPGSDTVVRGQIDSRRAAFSRLELGLVAASILVYLLMVVNFQSWTDPFIIITALSGAFTGVVWGLFITHTTFSVPSLMGAIMSIGVATANSILLVTFASERMELGRTSIEAAIDAGCTRLRPILMTALAMIIGMFPMALGLGEGGEQNAPLARAVIGGLALATLATLFFVPLMFTVLRRPATALQEKSA